MPYGLNRGLLIVALVLTLVTIATESALRAQDADQRLPRRTVTVHPLFFYTRGDGSAGGSCETMEITVGGAEPGRVRIGFFDSDVGASGDQWQSAGWMASVAAAQFTDFNPHTMQVSFDVQGRIDGPSAGGLMTVGVLAAARGDDVRQDAAMTGTINPDGIIGPVGGIPHKIRGAADEGMKMVLIPAGIRREVDDNTGQSVDLIEHGRSLGVEVRPVLDIYQAYELMTGKQLLRPARADHPRVPADVNELMRDRIQQWVTLTSNGIEKYNKLPQNARIEFTDDMQEVAKEYFDTASKLLSEGQNSAAYSDLINGSMMVYMALEGGRCVQVYQQSGYRGTVNRLRNNGWLQEDVEEVARRLRTTEPKTLDQLAMYLTACDAFFEAVAFQKLAQHQLANLPAAESEYATVRALDAAGWQIMAWVDLKLAHDSLDLVAEYKGTPIPDGAPVFATADFYRRAADASLSGFESIHIAPQAKAYGITNEAYSAELASKDPYYALLTNAQREVLPNLSSYLGDGPQLAYGYLAASMSLYSHSSMLVAKYYSLSPELDENKQIVSVGRELTFGEWLEESEDEARRNIAILNECGIKATACTQYYEIARVWRHRELGDRLNALEMYFDVNITARVLRRIAGYRLVPREDP